MSYGFLRSLKLLLTYHTVSFKEAKQVLVRWFKNMLYLRDMSSWFLSFDIETFLIKVAHLNFFASFEGFHKVTFGVYDPLTHYLRQNLELRDLVILGRGAQQVLDGLDVR